MNTTIPDYCSNNTLLIPESLFSMADAKPLMVYGHAAIFHKLISQDMRGIEFFTNAPCIAYVLRGTETFFSPDHEEFVLQEGEMLFMPRELHMVSDFANNKGPLEAILFFFSEEIIKDFLRRLPLTCIERASTYQPYKLTANDPISHYIASLKPTYQNFAGTHDLLRIKLLELLFMIKELHDPHHLAGFLSSMNAACIKRNIKHLMRNQQAYKLTVKDFATLSGRSLSSFNRDFRRQFDMSPVQWLINARLERAFELVCNSKCTITQIAMDVGYTNTSHFIKAFKDKYAETPKQVRLSQNSLALA